MAENKAEIITLLAPAWPPPDAEELIASWEDLGRPEIPLSQGIAISNLRIWFHPMAATEHMLGHMAAMRGFIYEGLPACEAPAAFTIPGLFENDGCGGR